MSDEVASLSSFAAGLTLRCKERVAPARPLRLQIFARPFFHAGGASKKFTILGPDRV